MPPQKPTPNSELENEEVPETQLPRGPKKLFNKLASAMGAAANAVSQQTEQTAQTIENAAKSTGSTLANTANQTGQHALNTATAATHNVTNLARQTGHVAANTANSITHAAGKGANCTTSGVSQFAELVQSNPLLKKATETLNIDWLGSLVDTVDVRKAIAQVDKLRAKHPNDSPSQLAHRLMIRKATLAAGSGLASSALPGMATALFAMDFAATMSLQAELVYQIAAAYDLDLEDPARKGEVLAIFGLSMGGSKAIEGGVKYATQAGILGFLRNVPAAGAVIGCSTNAAMTYSLGYGACRFYEAKLNPLQSEIALDASVSASDAYLKQAIAQEVVMDLILIHVMLADNPEKSIPDRLPALKTILGLAPTTLETLEKEGLPELSTLLSQVNEDFAAPLINRCQKIIELDSIVTNAEAAMIQEISETLGEHNGD